MIDLIFLSAPILAAYWFHFSISWPLYGPDDFHWNHMLIAISPRRVRPPERAALTDLELFSWEWDELKPAGEEMAAENTEIAITKKAAPSGVKKKQPVRGGDVSELRCSTCTQTKPVADFYSQGKFADGIMRYKTRCKECENRAAIIYRKNRKDAAEAVLRSKNAVAVKFESLEPAYLKG
jgi:hypothetical protein